MRIESGATLDDRFVIEAELGSGGSGEVWRARDLSTGQEVALKVLHEEKLRHSRAVSRFEREARILTRLEHPGIARLVAARIDGEIAYFAMELVGGVPLDYELRVRSAANQLFSIPEVCTLALSITRPLSHAHELGIAHRDLTPRNVMLINESELKLIDFGLAKLVDDDASDGTTVGRVLGTPLYRAPELCRGSGDSGPLTDIYGLGVLLYELLTLRRVWAIDDQGNPLPSHAALSLGVNDRLALTERILTSPRPRPSQVRRDVPPALNDLIVKMLAVELADRPTSAKQCENVIQRIQEDLGTQGATRTVMLLANDPTVARLGEAMDTAYVAPTAFISPTTITQAKGMRGLALPVSTAVIAISLASGAIWYASRDPAVETTASEPDRGPPGVAPVDATMVADGGIKPAVDAGRPDSAVVDKGVRDPTPPTKKRTEPTPAPVRNRDSLRAVVAQAKANPENPEAFRIALEKCQARVAALPEGDLRTTLEKRLKSARVTREADVLDRIVDALE